MKKLLLMFSAGLVSTGAMAQSAHKAAHTTSHAAKFTATATPEAATIKTSAAPATANKTTGTHNRWFNHSIAAAAYNVSGNTTSADNLDSAAYYGPLAGLLEMWPDSTIHYPSPDDAYGITYLSIAEAFQPQGAEYNSSDLYPNEVAAGDVIDNTMPYTIDSISVLGFYTQVDPTLVDTLVFTITNESPTFKYPFASYDATVLASHGVDSFAEILWRTVNYGVAPLNQTSYTYTGDSLMGFTQIKVPLNTATVSDTIVNGMLAGFMRISVAPNISMIAGSMSAVSVAYKPNSSGSYPNGSTIDLYNHFNFLSHKPDTLGGFAQYMPNDFNMSYIVPKDTTNTNVNASLAIFVPTIGFTSAQFFPEEHDISFKATWVSNLSVGNMPKNVASVNAYPNPAVTVLNIPVTMAQASTVSVTLTNTAGQVVMTQDLGTVSGGTTKTASFGISPLASGVYFYTVNAGGQTITNRVTVAH